MGVEKGFAVKDINKDDVINGADLGFHYQGYKFVTNSPDNPVAPAKADKLADHIYQTEVVTNKKKFVLLGEQHTTNVEDIAQNLVTRARTDGKSVTYAVEWPKDYFAPIEQYLASVPPADLDNGSAKQKILVHYLKKRLPGGDKMSDTDLLAALDKRKGSSLEAAAAEHRVDVLIAMKKAGAAIKFVDVDMPAPAADEKPEDAAYKHLINPQREVGVANNLKAAGEGQDLVIAELGMLHVAGDRAHSPFLANGDPLKSITSASEHLMKDTPNQVARVMIYSDPNDTQAAYYAGRATEKQRDAMLGFYNNNEAEMPTDDSRVDPKGGLAAGSADQFLYYDWR